MHVLLMGFVDFMLFMIFRQGEKTQKQNKTKRKDNAGNKREVRETYLSATSGGRRWIRSYAANAIGEVHCFCARSTGATGAANGSARSTGAAKVGGRTNLDDAATELAVDAAIASPSVPQTRQEGQVKGITLMGSKGSTRAEQDSEKSGVDP